MNKPWQIHPALTPNRLTTIAEILSRVRSEVVSEHQPDKGDGSWGLGCRAYERSIFALEQLIASRLYPWLTLVERDGLHFVFAVGGVPIRFFHGDHEDPADVRRLRRRQPELYAQQRAFDFVPQAVMEPVLRLIIETDSDGRADGIFIVQFDEKGKPHNPWTIPFERVTLSIDEFRKEGVELPPPTVGDQPPAAEANDQADEGDQKAE